MNRLRSRDPGQPGPVVHLSAVDPVRDL